MGDVINHTAMSELHLAMIAGVSIPMSALCILYSQAIAAKPEAHKYPVPAHDLRTTNNNTELSYS